MKSSPFKIYLINIPLNGLIIAFQTLVLRIAQVCNTFLNKNILQILYVENERDMTKFIIKY